MSETETESTEPQDTEPTEPQARRFSEWLEEEKNASLHGEASDSLAAVVAAVIEYQKVGSLTLKLKIKAADHRSVVVAYEVKADAPEGERPVALFFADEHGNMSRKDHMQPELPLREPPIRNVSNLREVNAN